MDFVVLNCYFQKIKQRPRPKKYSYFYLKSTKNLHESSISSSYIYSLKMNNFQQKGAIIQIKWLNIYNNT